MTQDTYVHGIFNVEKCAIYLRSVGIDVTPDMERQWLDAQSAHRFLRSMKRTQAEGWDWVCAKGHRAYIETRRGQRRRSSEQEDVCECGARWAHGSCRWRRARDGTLADYRPPDERWRPLDWQPPSPPDSATTGPR